MKKLGLLALACIIGALMMSAPTLATPSAAAYQQQQPPPLEPQEAADLYGKYYAEKDQAKKYEMAKEFLEKYPNVNPYWQAGPKKFIATYELGKVYTKCQEADKTFFGSPNEANLNNFIAACDAWINKAPKPDVYYTTRISLGTGYGVLASFYKDTARGESFTGKALGLLAPTAPPEGWKPEDWNNFRKENIGRLTQYQGLYRLRQTPADNEGAIKYLSDAAAFKEGPAVKDPNTYLLRAEATTAIYTKLNAEYNALSDDDKRGDKGKALLNQIYPVVAKMANDYARVVALTEGKADYKAIYDDAKSQTKAFVEFINKTVSPDDLYKAFKADISAADVNIPREETSAAPPTINAPPTGKGAKAIATTAGGTAGPSNGTDTKAGAKATTTTTPTTKKPAAPARKRN
ncbi:MAG: hypothetical protein U0Y68_06730 [Blastocatellia bacterium]